MKDKDSANQMCGAMLKRLSWIIMLHQYSSTQFSQPQQDTSNNRMRMSTSNKKTICQQFQQFLTTLTILMF
jgi:hypothetical protein